MHGRGDYYLWRAGLKYFRTSLTVIGRSRQRVKHSIHSLVGIAALGRLICLDGLYSGYLDARCPFCNELSAS